MQPRALLADDEQKVRAALRLLLENEAGVSVVGEAADATSLFHETAASHPDLVLLDWELPGLGVATSEDTGASPWKAVLTPAPALMQSLKSCCPNVRVIALSWRSEAKAEALAAGVHAFVSKLAAPELLLDVLDEVLNSPGPGTADDYERGSLPAKLQEPGGATGEASSSLRR